MNEFYSENKVSLGTQLTQSALHNYTVHNIVLYCNGFIIIFTYIIHKKQTQEIKHF